MPLSEYEQRVLADIEAGLIAEATARRDRRRRRVGGVACLVAMAWTCAFAALVAAQVVTVVVGAPLAAALGAGAGVLVSLQWARWRRPTHRGGHRSWRRRSSTSQSQRA